MSCNCNTASKTCEPCAYCTPPGVTNLPDCNPKDPCDTILDLCCVLYNGEDKPCIDVTNGENLCDVLIKILETLFPPNLCTTTTTSTTTTSTSTTTTTTTVCPCYLYSLPTSQQGPVIYTFVECEQTQPITVSISQYPGIYCISEAYPIIVNSPSDPIQPVRLNCCSVTTTTTTTTQCPCSEHEFFGAGRNQPSTDFTFILCGDSQPTTITVSDFSLYYCVDRTQPIIQIGPGSYTDLNICCATTTTTSSTTTTTSSTTTTTTSSCECYYVFNNSENQDELVVYPCPGGILEVPLASQTGLDLCVQAGTVPYSVQGNTDLIVTLCGAGCTTNGDCFCTTSTTTTTTTIYICTDCFTYLVSNMSGDVITGTYVDCVTLLPVSFTLQNTETLTTCACERSISILPIPGVDVVEISSDCTTTTTTSTSTTTTTSTSTTTSTTSTTTTSTSTTTTTTTLPCECYNITNNSLVLDTVFVDICDAGIFYLPIGPGVTTPVCVKAGTIPYSTTGNLDVLIVLCGGTCETESDCNCTTTTSTSTTSTSTTTTTTTTEPPVITCNNYTIEGTPSIDVEWIDCNGTPNSATVPEIIIVCAQTGSVVQTGGTGTITPGGSCSITTTTTTAEPVTCTSYTVTNTDLEIDLYFDYTNCVGLPVMSIIVSPGNNTIVCAQTGTVVIASGIGTITPGSSCT